MTMMAMEAAPATARVGASGVDAVRWGAHLQSAGDAILRYGTAAILLYFGTFKFTAVEAEAIRPLVSESPLMAWMYSLLSVRGVSSVIGVMEIVVALLILARRWLPRAAALGGIGGIVIFATTLTFLFTTPGMWASAPGFPLPVPAGGAGFILKDLFLLGACAWIAGEALRATARPGAGS